VRHALRATCADPRRGFSVGIDRHTLVRAQRVPVPAAVLYLVLRGHLCPDARPESVLQVDVDSDPRSLPLTPSVGARELALRCLVGVVAAEIAATVLTELRLVEPARAVDCVFPLHPTAATTTSAPQAALIAVERRSCIIVSLSARRLDGVNALVPRHRQSHLPAGGRASPRNVPTSKPARQIPPRRLPCPS
jgi:hypothetical protein